MYRSFGIYTLVFGILYSSIHAFMDRRNKLTRKGNFLKDENIKFGLILITFRAGYLRIGDWH